MSIRKAPNTPAREYPTGTKKKGLDGKLWVVVKNVNDVKRWQKVVRGKRDISTRKTIRIENGKLRKTIKSKKPDSESISSAQDDLVKLIENLYEGDKKGITKLRKTLRITKRSPSPSSSPDIVKTLRKTLKIKNPELKGKTYYIYDRESYPWKVVKAGSKIYIYKLTKPANSMMPKGQHSKLIAKYGNITDTDILKGRDRFQKKLGINSLLVRLSKERYLFIGPMIYEFTTKNPILKLYSSMGNNNITYPVAESRQNVFFMLDKTYIPKEKMPSNIVMHTSYKEYYGFDINSPLSKYALKMKGTKMIAKLHNYRFGKRGRPKKQI